MKNMIFIGAPGSGKGTQSALFSKKGMKHVSTGDLLRSEIARGSELGKKVKQVMDSGALVSDDLVIEILRANLDLGKASYIFDGYPRNEAQAKTLDSAILKGAPSVAIYFEINTQKLVQRLVNRRTCKGCGEIYNLQTKVPKVAGVCDVCGSKELVHRADDQEEVILKRMSVFATHTEPVLAHYAQTGRLVKIDAEKSADEIAKIIEKHL
jgi:adenylate kinase